METVRTHYVDQYGYGRGHQMIEVEHRAEDRYWRSMFQVPYGMPADVAKRRAIEYHYSKYGEHRADFVLRQEHGLAQGQAARLRHLEREVSRLSAEVVMLKYPTVRYLG